VTEYVVIYEQAGDGAWSAYIPDLPGCVSGGTTRTEAERNIREAVALYLSDTEAPAPRSFAGVVAA
jgi:predicted RNase H-like HicB family nuclease